MDDFVREIVSSRLADRLAPQTVDFTRFDTKLNQLRAYRALKRDEEVKLSNRVNLLQARAV
jgi:hypothetical protein